MMDWLLLDVLVIEQITTWLLDYPPFFPEVIFLDKAVVHWAESESNEWRFDDRERKVPACLGYISGAKIDRCRHPRESGDPVSLHGAKWIPAFAGMTTVFALDDRGKAL